MSRIMAGCQPGVIQPRYAPVTSTAPTAIRGCARRLPFGRSYAGTAWATSAPVAGLPGAVGVSAVAWRMAADLTERDVQRSVHPSVSRQYQRTSRHALPPSATIWSAGRRMPHIQQDLIPARSPHNGTGRCW
jgi:hypothetical protein